MINYLVIAMCLQDKIRNVISGCSDNEDYVVLITPGLRESTHSVKILALGHSLLLKGFSNVFVLNYRASCSVSCFWYVANFVFFKMN